MSKNKKISNNTSKKVIKLVFVQKDSEISETLSMMKHLMRIMKMRIIILIHNIFKCIYFIIYYLRFFLFFLSTRCFHFFQFSFFLINLAIFHICFFVHLLGNISNLRPFPDFLCLRIFCCFVSFIFICILLFCLFFKWHLYLCTPNYFCLHFLRVCVFFV